MKYLGKTEADRDIVIFSELLTEEEIMQSLIESNVLSAVTSGGEILTDENNNILMM